VRGNVDIQGVEGVLRALAVAARSVRLYPPSSAIPRQSAQTAAAACAELFFSGASGLHLDIAREGFSIEGGPVGSGAPSVVDFANVLREHGVAAVTLTPPVPADEVLGFVGLLARPVDETRAHGGFGSVLASLHIEHLRVADVHLATAGTAAVPSAVDAGLESWLQDLGSDADRLSAWYSAASAGDPAAFEDGLIEIARASGELGAGLFDSALADAFNRQSPAAKDALLTRANDSAAVRDLVGRMLRELTAEQIAEALTSGVLGGNMLSLSHALTSLPLGSAAAAVRVDVSRMASEAGHSAKELAFLDHMIETRSRRGIEPPLAEADHAYTAVRDATRFADTDVSEARDVVIASSAAVNRAGVRTMLALLDQQQDFTLYCETVDALVALVPGLIETGELGLAKRILQELANRQSGHTAPWPELTTRLEAALATAAGSRSMRAVIAAVMADRARTAEAREIVALMGEPAGNSLVIEAVSLKAEGIEVAERLLGNTRVLELLCAHSTVAEWHQLEPLVSRLAREHDSACMAAVQALLSRPDARSRREVAQGLAGVAAPAPSRLLALGLRDADSEIAMIVAVGVAKCGVPGSADLLCSRLDELNIDGSDYAFGRDLIGALALTPESAAGDALDRLASRRSLMKRGHFADVQAAVAKARQARMSGGVGR